MQHFVGNETPPILLLYIERFYFRQEDLDVPLSFPARVRGCLGFNVFRAMCFAFYCQLSFLPLVLSKMGKTKDARS